MRAGSRAIRELEPGGVAGKWSRRRRTWSGESGEKGMTSQGDWLRTQREGRKNPAPAATSRLACRRILIFLSGDGGGGVGDVGREGSFVAFLSSRDFGC